MEKRSDLPIVVIAGIGTIVVRGASLLFGVYLGRDSSASKAWPTTNGKILTSRVVARTEDSPPHGYMVWYEPTIFYSYRGANGRQYEGNAVFERQLRKKKAQEWVQHNPPGTEFAVIYDPERPHYSALPGDPSGKRSHLASLVTETSIIRPQYQASETDYVMQWYQYHHTPAYWGSLSADNGILTCVGCAKAKPLGSCPNCRHEQQFFRTEGDENWIPHSTSVGFSSLEGVEGYVRCHNCGNAWRFWICECGTRNNIRQSIGWKDHITAETPKAGCFIATAVYGTEHATEVQVLRRFRDEKLKNWKYGEILIRVYQKGSPPVADWIADNPKARLLTRKFFLSPLVWGVANIMKRTKEAGN